MVKVLNPLCVSEVKPPASSAENTKDSSKGVRASYSFERISEPSIKETTTEKPDNLMVVEASKVREGVAPGEVSMSTIKDTKEFVGHLKTLTLSSPSWEGILKVLDDSSKQYCIDYLVYLGGLEPLLAFLKVAKKRRTTMRVMDFLLKVAAGHHVYQCTEHANAICSSIHFLLSHPSEAVRTASTTLQSILQGRTAMQKDLDKHEDSVPTITEITSAVRTLVSTGNTTNDNSIRSAVENLIQASPKHMLPYKALITQLATERVHELRCVEDPLAATGASYGREVNGRWAYVSPSLVKPMQADKIASEDNPCYVQRWLFCRIMQTVQGGKGHLVKIFEPHEASTTGTDRIDEGTMELILTPENTRFLTEKEGQDALRGVGRSLKRRRPRLASLEASRLTTVDTSQKKKVDWKVDEKISLNSKDSMRSNEIREAKGVRNSCEATLNRDELDLHVELAKEANSSSLPPLRKLKERLDLLDQSVVKMRIRQWQATQVPLRRLRRGPARKPRPVFLTRNLHVNPCFKTFSLLGKGKLRASHTTSKQRHKLESSNTLKNASVMKQKLSAYPGVSWSVIEQAWRASTTERSRCYHIGYFESEHAAWRAIRTYRESNKWPVTGPAPNPPSDGSVEPPEENAHKDQRTSFPGVRWSSVKQRWIAVTSYRGMKISLGYFLTKNMAWRAICSKRRHLKWPAKSAAMQRPNMNKATGKTSKRLSDRNLTVDIKMANKIDNRRRKYESPSHSTFEPKAQTSPIHESGATKYVSWNMYQKINRGRQVTSKEWRAYNEDLARRAESSSPGIPTTNDLPSLKKASTSNSGRYTRKRLREEGTSPLVSVGLSPVSKKQREAVKMIFGTQKPAGAKGNQFEHLEAKTAGIQTAAAAAAAAAAEPRSMTVEEIYDILEEFKEHFNNSSSAVVWLMTATPTKFRRLLVPSRYRVPASYQGSGGYASAFERVQLIVTDADKAGSRWHRWYAAPHVDLENLQAALKRRWEEAAPQREKTAAKRQREAVEISERGAVKKQEKIEIETPKQLEAEPSTLISTDRVLLQEALVVGSKRLRASDEISRIRGCKRNASQGRPETKITPGDPCDLEIAEEGGISAKVAETEETESVLTPLQGQWLSSYEGVRTDPTVAGEHVLFRNGTRYSLFKVRGRLTIDGMWAMDTEVSTPEMCIWRHLRRPRANPVVWTRKEMPARKAKHMPLKFDAPVSVGKASPRSSFKFNKTDTQTQASVKTPHEHGYGIEQRSQTLTTPGKDSRELSRQCKATREGLITPPAGTIGVTMGRGGLNGDPDLFAVACLLAGFQREDKENTKEGFQKMSRLMRTDSKASDIVDGFEESGSVNEEREGDDGERNIEFLSEEEEDDDQVHEGDSEQPSFAFEQLLSSVDQHRTNLRFDEFHAKDAGASETSAEVASATSLSRSPLAQELYNCFACGGRVHVEEGRETAECEACGNKAMTYRYKHCRSAVSTLIASAERRFNNSGKGFRGWNRHGHVEWVQDEDEDR